MRSVRLRVERSARTWAAECQVVPEGQPVALQQDGVGDAGLGEVIEGRATHDSAADDDDGGVGGQGGVGHGASLVRSAGGAKAPRPEWFAVCVAAGPRNIRPSMKT